MPSTNSTGSRVSRFAIYLHSHRKLTTMHAVALTLGNHTRILSVDRATCLETDDFVGVFFLPQIQAAVDQLASWE